MRLGVDFGTSHTVAVMARGEGRGETLLFDSSPLLPSAVWVGADGAPLVGRDAQRSARLDPSAYEPNPKRRIDEVALLLGRHELPVVDAVAAVLRRVAQEAVRVAGTAPDATVLTHPAGWGPQRRGLLVEAARRAGLPGARLVAEPVAAAMYFTTVLGHRVPDGHAVVVYDFGGGTFDISVVRRAAGGWRVDAAQGLDDVGGVDLDAAVVSWIGRAVSPRDPALWQRLVQPQSLPDRRQGRILWDDARAAKESLSRATTAGIPVPLFDVDLHLTRAEFEALARPWLERTVALTAATLSSSGTTADRLAGVFLVGGASRVPLVATLLHRALGVPPVVLEQPELVVAQGSLLADTSTDPAPDTAAPWAPPLDTDAPTVAHPIATPAAGSADPPAPPPALPVSPAPTPPPASPVSPAPAATVVAPVPVRPATATSAPVTPAPTGRTAAVKAPWFAVGGLVLGALFAVALGVSISTDSADTTEQTWWILITVAVGLALPGLWPVSGALPVRVLVPAAFIACGVAVTVVIGAVQEDAPAGAIATVSVAMLFLPAVAIVGWRRRLWSLPTAAALTLFPVAWILDGMFDGRLLGIPEALVLTVAAVSLALGTLGGARTSP